MNNELVKTEGSSLDLLTELQATEKLVQALMASKHYSKMGTEGIYAVVQKAKSMGINPLDALNGGCYYVQGKVEMSSQMMNRLIRSKGHSIRQGDNSSKTCCVLHGKRADNGDSWTVSFDIEDAKRAGIYKPNGVWEKYPSVMCFNRALSMLARQLFPDVIVDCYVTGEISEAPPLEAPVVMLINPEMLAVVDGLIDGDDNPNELKTSILERYQISSIDELPADKVSTVIKRIKERHDKQRALREAAKTIEVSASVEETSDF